MSVPSIKIYCDRCDYTSAFSILKDYRYTLPNNADVPIACTNGWCDNCERFTKVETLKDERDIQDNIFNLDAKLSTIYSRKLSLWPWTRTKQQVRNNLDRGYIQQQRANALLYGELCRQRQSPPRCLSCGGTEIQPIRLLNGKITKTAKVPFVHPNCGGQLWTKESEMRFILKRPNKCMYTMEGIFIDEIETF